MGKKRKRQYVVPPRLSTWEIEEQRRAEEQRKAEEQHRRDEEWQRRMAEWHKRSENKNLNLSYFRDADIEEGSAWEEDTRLFDSRWDRFKLLVNKKACPDMPYEPVIDVWHGTSLTNLKSIARCSLTQGKSGAFGGGIYSTRDIDKASHYGTRSNNDMLILLRCKLAVGNVWQIGRVGDYRDQIGPDREYQSLHAGAGVSIAGAWGGSFRGEEFVVYDPAQVFVEAVYVWKKRVIARPVVVTTSRFGAREVAFHHRQKKAAAAQDNTPKRRKTEIPNHPCHRLQMHYPTARGRLASHKTWVLCRYAAMNRKGVYRCTANLPTTDCERCKRFSERL